MSYFFPAPLITFATPAFSLLAAVNTATAFTPATSPLMNFFPTGGLIDIISVTGSTFGTTPQITLGTNATAYNNLMGAMTITASNANTANTTTMLTIDNGAIVVPANSTIFCNISRAVISGGGTPITACMVRVIVWGFYF